MIILIRYVRNFWKLDYNLRIYASVLIFIGILIFHNYYLFPLYTQQNLGFQKYLYHYFYKHQNPLNTFIYMGYNAFPLLGAMFIQSYFTKNWQVYKNRRFWLYIAFILFVFSFPITSFFQEWLAQKYINTNNYYYFYKTFYYVFYTSLSLLLILGFWYLQDRNYSSTSRYVFGLNLQNLQLKPYFYLICCIAPFMYIAANQPHFLTYYPTISWENGLKHFTAFSKKWAFIIYEINYALNFIKVELIFRGMLIIGMIKFLGKDCILPMVCFYCTIHFGKPLGECLSSIAGGYIVGTFAYYSKNIYGGIIVHIFIALSMDIIAFLQILYKG